MKVDGATKLLAAVFQLADVDGQSARAAFNRTLRDIENPARPGGDSRHAGVRHTAFVACTVHRLAIVGIEKFGARIDGARSVQCFHGPGVGGIRPDKAAVAIAQPCRGRNGVEQCAQRRGFLCQLFMPLCQESMVLALARQVTHSNDRRTGSHPARYLDQTADLCGQHHMEGFTIAAQSFHGALKCGGGLRVEPCPESQKSRRRPRNAAGLIKHAGDHRRRVARLPDDQALIIGIDEALQTVETRRQTGIFFSHSGKGPGRGPAIAQERHRRGYSKCHRAADSRDPDNLERVDVAERQGGCILRPGSTGKGQPCDGAAGCTNSRLSTQFQPRAARARMLQAVRRHSHDPSPPLRARNCSSVQFCLTNRPIRKDHNAKPNREEGFLAEK